MDPAKHTSAEIRYEVQILSSYDFTLRGVRYQPASASDDIVVIVRETFSGRVRMDWQIVGVIGSAAQYDSTEFMRLHNFLRAGGVIGLNRELA